MKDGIKQVNDIMVVWELRGGYPEIATFTDVDIAALTQGDDDPFYVTLPIGEDNVTSRNKNHYDEAFVTELARQTQARKPIGIMGHLSKERIENMEFPDEAVHWVGVKKEGSQLWGKAYVVPGAARDRVRRYKATGRPMATSIFAHMGLKWDSALGAYRAQADTLDLMQIDLGPVDRAGIQSVSAVPHITKELVNENTEEKEMDKLDVIREMTADDARLLPDPVRQAIIAGVQTPPEVAIVSELRTELGDGDMLAVIREMKKEQETRKAAAVTGRITKLVTEGIKVESLRPLVVELVQAKAPATVEAVEGAYKAVAESVTVTELLKAHVTQTGGPPLRTGLQGQQGGNKYFVIPQKDGE
jgi:hypothetical protein